MKNPDFLDQNARARYIQNNPKRVNSLPKFETFDQSRSDVKITEYNGEKLWREAP